MYFYYNVEPDEVSPLESPQDPEENPVLANTRARPCSSYLTFHLWMFQLGGHGNFVSHQESSANGGKSRDNEGSVK
jgi:hypothetical protein